MPDSIRQKIVDEVKKQLKKIKKSTSGYETDAGLHVFEWRDTEAKPITDDEMPAIVWRDIQGPINYDESRTVNIHGLTLECEAFASGVDAPKIIRKILADINKAIFSTNTTDLRKTWGGFATDTFPDSENMVFKEGSKGLMSAVFTFRIEYHTSKFDAYSQ